MDWGGGVRTGTLRKRKGTQGPAKQPVDFFRQVFRQIFGGIEKGADSCHMYGIRVTLKKVEWSVGGVETNVGGYRRRECPMIAIILLHWTLIVGTSEVQSWDGPQHCEWLFDASHLLWGMCGELVERLITFWRLIWLLTSQCLEDRILLMPEWTMRIYRFNVFFGFDEKLIERAFR